jgi:hypothetical protein
MVTKSILAAAGAAVTLTLVTVAGPALADPGSGNGAVIDNPSCSEFEASATGKHVTTPGGLDNLNCQYPGPPDASQKGPITIYQCSDFDLGSGQIIVPPPGDPSFGRNHCR